MNNLLTAFTNNLFGSISGGNFLGRASGVDFIPKDGDGRIIKLTDHSPVWLGLRSPLMQLYAYEFCYPVASVVDALAEYDLTGKVLVLRKTGKGKDDLATSPYASQITTLLEQPNPLQSWQQFRGQQLVYKRVFGFCPVVGLIPVGFKGNENSVGLLNLPPWLFSVEGTRKLVDQSTIQGFIKKYRVTLLGSLLEMDPDRVMILTDSFLQDERQDFLLPLSRLVGLDMAVSNICASNEADNVLLRKKGPLGVFSHDAAAVKDSVAGYLPMTNVDKKELQDELLNYGLTFSQYQWLISKVAIKWLPMSYDTKQLGTKETLVAGEKAICHRFRFPYVLYEQTDTTYANGENAETNLYTTNVIPNADKDIQQYNKFLKTVENNCVITRDFSEVDCLQADKLSAAQAVKTEAEGYEKLFYNNVVTLNQWRMAMGYDTVMGDDRYYRDIQPILPAPPTETIRV